MTVIIKRKRSDSPADDQQHNQEIPDFGGISLATMANYLVLLSQGAHHHQQQQQQQQHTSPFVCFDSSSSATTSSSDHHLPTTTTQQRVFECKTCNRQFPSFQALGGHRASHKRPKLQHHDANGNGNGTTTHSSDSTPIPHKPKSHECSICGLEFPIGQALGGHMRRHRAIYTDHGGSTAPILFPPPPQQPHPTSHLSISLKLATTSPHHIPVKKPSTSIASEMLRRTTSGRATLCLDLNLTPFENGVDQLGKLAPIYG